MSDVPTDVVKVSVSVGLKVPVIGCVENGNNCEERRIENFFSDSDSIMN